MAGRPAVQPRIRKRIFELPWPFKYLGWLVCLASIAGGAVFLWAFALKFENEKTYLWLTTMIISFFAELLFLEPLKVINDLINLLLLIEDFW